MEAKYFQNSNQWWGCTIHVQFLFLKPFSFMYLIQMQLLLAYFTKHYRTELIITCDGLELSVRNFVIKVIKETIPF